MSVAKGSARGRAEQQPRHLSGLRSPSLSVGLIRLKAALIALTCVAALLLTSALTAQTFTTLHSFAGYPSEGSWPLGLILSRNTMYGATPYDGSSGDGTVFAIKTDGTGFTNLHNFTAGSDGGDPNTGLVLSGTLYGTTFGTVFAVNTDGTGFSTLYTLSAESDGATPSGLIISGNTLYGTAYNGGSFPGSGTVFVVNTDGTGFTTLYDFTGGSDGDHPSGLVLSGNTLYGTAYNGGSSGGGTVFAVGTDGMGFTTLHSFTAVRDGVGPNDLILSGNTLYGTAEFGGSSGNGTVFALKTDGTGLTTLHSFTATPCCGFGGPNSDGAQPVAGLFLSGNTLYGTALEGGSAGVGTVFAVNTDGMGFTTLHSFTARNNNTNSDGAYPHAGLVLSGNTLYGTAQQGGSSGNGTVFSLSFTPHLTIVPSGKNVILTWPTNYAGFDYTGFTLQSTTNLVSSALWTTVSPGPVVIDGQNAVTNLISGTQQFYRLAQ